MTILTRTVETTNCIADVAFDDKAFTLTIEVRSKGAVKPARTFRRFRDRESARQAFANVIANVQGVGASLNMKLQPAGGR